MKRSRTAIVHFLPLEGYPPVMNMINFLCSLGKSYLAVFSTAREESCWFEAESHCKIYRFGIQTKSPFSRYVLYVTFNFLTFFRLCFFRPSTIIYYETYSSLPALLYKKLFPKTKLIIHFHEYSSPPEIARSSAYFKWLHRIEKRGLCLSDWISHTNEQRLELFLKDNGLFYHNKYRVMPNYPPRGWAQTKIESVNKTSVFRFVYVGALNMQTTFVEEFAKWVEAQNGKVIWDIYCQQDTSEISIFLKSIAAKYIQILHEVNYFELPRILSMYNAGVILYKPHVKNIEFCAPNKLFEYLACDLDIYYPEVMQGCKPYKTLFEDRIFELDFTNLNSFEIKNYSGTRRKVEPAFYCEEEYRRIVPFL